MTQTRVLPAAALAVAVLLSITAAHGVRAASDAPNVTVGTVFYNSAAGTYSFQVCKSRRLAPGRPWLTCCATASSAFGPHLTPVVQAGVQDPQGAATASLDDQMSVQGWMYLRLQTNAALPDAVQMFAAGYLEACLTAHSIFLNFQNTYTTTNLGDEKVPLSMLASAQLSHLQAHTTCARAQKLRKWFAHQDDWTRKQIRDNPADPFWRHMGLVTAQLDGLAAGYNASARPEEPLDFFAMQFLNANGDVGDVVTAINKDMRPDWLNMPTDEAYELAMRKTHCSALVKLTPGYEQMFMGHSTWTAFNGMLRIFKHYNLQLADSAVAARKISFSSYPGFLVSVDDFYVMDSGLVMLETTNNIFNNSLYDFVSHDSLLAWQRVRLANGLAHDGAEWTQIIARENSGTYNNQYMIINLNHFTPGQPLLDGTLWVSEQIPSLVVGADVTYILRDGHWPSYNVPFFEQIYNMSGAQFVRCAL
jgi:hypothetical protein